MICVTGEFYQRLRINNNPSSPVPRNKEGTTPNSRYGAGVRCPGTKARHGWREKRITAVVPQDHRCTHPQRISKPRSKAQENHSPRASGTNPGDPGCFDSHQAIHRRDRVMGRTTGPHKHKDLTQTTPLPDNTAQQTAHRRNVPQCDGGHAPNARPQLTPHSTVKG